MPILYNKICIRQNFIQGNIYLLALFLYQLMITKSLIETNSLVIVHYFVIINDNFIRIIDTTINNRSNKNKQQ